MNRHGSQNPRNQRETIRDFSPATFYPLPPTIYQLPSTIYQLPAFPTYNVLKKKELREKQRTICEADYRLDSGQVKLPAGYFN